MKPIHLFLCLLFTALLPALSATAEQEWISLFDGKSVDAWKAYQKDTFPHQAWSVENGILTSRKGVPGVDIITRETFTDFELELEWRTEPKGNSGIFFRVNEEAPLVWNFAPEYQILDDGPKTAPVHTSGSFYDILPPNNKKKLNPPGEFNTARIVSRGNKIEHWLNGEKILSYDFDDPEIKYMIGQSKFSGFPQFAQSKTGAIGLQHHGHEIGFRNIRIRKISPDK